MKVHIVQNLAELKADPVSTLEVAEVVTGGLDAISETVRTLAHESFLSVLVSQYPHENKQTIIERWMSLRILPHQIVVTICMECPHLGAVEEYVFVAVERTVCTATPVGVVVAEVVEPIS